MTVYCLSGLGADERIFKKLTFPQGYTPVFLSWPEPHKDEDLQEYVHRLALNIKEEHYVLCGVSFGGICMQEMCRFLKPEKLILISSICGPEEVSQSLKLAAKVRLQSLFPQSFYKWLVLHSASVLGINKAEEVEDFQQMAGQFSPEYYEWAVKSVIDWQGSPSHSVPTLRLHGSHDQLFPPDSINGAEIIEGGEHIMVMFQAHEISQKIAAFLENQDLGR